MYKKGHIKTGGRQLGTKNKRPYSDQFLVDYIKDLIGTFKSGKYYVYKHIERGKEVYIGKGSHGRAWEQNRKINEHTQRMKRGLIKVKIMASDLSEKEAFAIEGELIKIRQPKYNNYFTDRTLEKDSNMKKISKAINQMSGEGIEYKIKWEN